jgi:hypothetical protein
MLTLLVGSTEALDESTNQFIQIGGTFIELEHSLVSLQAWESKWEKPFLGDDEKTEEMLLDYVKYMARTPNLPPEIFEQFSPQNFDEINTYFNAKMTATFFAESSRPAPGKKEIITAEVIYFWMVSLQVPFECQHWHLNQLLTLIRVCNEKNAPKKKSSQAEIVERNRRLNAARKKAMNTRG